MDPQEGVPGDPADPRAGQPPPAGPGDALRRRAEDQVRARGGPEAEALSPEEAGRLIHELSVHQIELEVQNEELRQAQEALEASRARYFDLYDLAPVGYVTLGETGLILEANLRAATLLGTPRSALVRQPLSRWIVPEDQDVYYQLRRRLAQTGEPQACELRMSHQGGGGLWARLEATRSRDGGEGSPVCRVTLSDIGERKQAEAEREKLQTQLVQAQKMEAVGRLAGGVAHDFNNLLMGIMNYVELCRDQLEPAHSIRPYLEEIAGAAERSANLTRQLLAFARKQVIAPRVLELNDTVGDMLKLLRRLIGADIEVVWKPGAGLWPVRMDPGQIDQILVNLCLNARDAIAMPARQGEAPRRAGGTGQVTIATRNVLLVPADCEGQPDLSPGSYVLLAVSDDGCGMAPDLAAHLFEPFFTSKETGRGTGLGLATVYGIVKQNRGGIGVSTQPGQGTTFRVYLPPAAGAIEAAREPAAPGEPPGGSETILLVEDEPAVRETCGVFLRQLGYRVLAAEGPAAALALAARHPGEIHLLLTDVIMPGMDGGELARRLVGVRPGCACLFMSGYPADVLAHRGVLEEVQFLPKPFSRQELAVGVRAALARRSPPPRVEET